MSVEIRIRSVERRIVTRYEKTETGASSSVVAEVQQPLMAERIGAALAAAEGGALSIEPSVAHPQQFAIVKHGFEPDTKVFYAYSQAEADGMKATLEAAEDGGEWRIFAR